MKRRKFIQNVAGTAIALHAMPLLANQPLEEDQISVYDLIRNSPTVEATPAMKKEFDTLLAWLEESKWNQFFHATFGFGLKADDPELQSKCAIELSDIQTKKGFEDFAGIRFIEPGFPSMSLLYHALASPRVKPSLAGVDFTEGQYPALEWLDKLENYIVSLKDLQVPEDFNEKYVFAIFAYEYRPAFKTPDRCPYAEFVYTRCGIARIGDQSMHYIKKNRSFLNLSSDPAKKKDIAVTPARYGLFLAKVLPFDDVRLMSEDVADKRNFIFFSQQKSFLQPVKKIFDGDPIIGSAEIKFFESHKSEKLARLTKRADITLPPKVFTVTSAPFYRESFSDDEGNMFNKCNEKLVSVTRAGASALVSSVPRKIIRYAEQDGKICCFYVPRKDSTLVDSNRRYTSLKLQNKVYSNAYDYIVTEGIAKKYKATRFGAPRNAPLFVNIRYVVDKDTYKLKEHYTGDTASLAKMDEGGYLAAMFEDSICDGCITASVDTTNVNDGIVSRKLATILPAFSLVTAPDFFPFVDSYDLMDYDKHGESIFMEGGNENLSASRLFANLNIKHPLTQQTAFADDKNISTIQYPQPVAITKTKGKKRSYSEEDVIAGKTCDTMLALIAGASKPVNGQYPEEVAIYQRPMLRDFEMTSYLTDTASFIFAPGWDATYSADQKHKTYLATFGLGSPFPEDMKLCAAANGMWPVASPDAARTFQGGLKPLPFYNTYTPCAIPLMDDEIGVHTLHPEVLNKTIAPTYGWDGEQGPYIDLQQDKVWLNFTDIGKSDYVGNLLDPSIGFDISRLRDLNCGEITLRIDCLRKCKKAIEGDKKEFSELWLVSAEKVDWRLGATGFGIPSMLIGNNRDWATVAQPTIKNDGYLYIFAEPVYDSFDDSGKTYKWANDKEKKRRLIRANKIVVCQVSRCSIAWRTVLSPDNSKLKILDWENA